MAHGITPGMALALAALAGFVAPAGAQEVRISSLSDVTFNTLASISTDQVQAQNVCAFSSNSTGRYSIAATGSGQSNAFTLSAGADTLPYEVQWASTASQTSGTSMVSGQALTGQVTNAPNSRCQNDTRPTATLIIVLRSTSLSQARAGTYSGTLTLLVAPN